MKNILAILGPVIFISVTLLTIDAVIGFTPSSLKNAGIGYNTIFLHDTAQFFAGVFVGKILWKSLDS